MRNSLIVGAVIVGLAGPSAAFAQTPQAPADAGASSTSDAAPPPKMAKKHKKKPAKKMAKPAADGGTD